MRSFIFLICCFVAGCTTYKFLGSEQPRYAISACPIENKFCSFNSNHEGAELNILYILKSVEGGAYTLKGGAKLDLSEKSPVYAKISRLRLTFIFFKDDLVVHEDTVTLRGEPNKFINFSLPIESNIDFESSKFATARHRVTE